MRLVQWLGWKSLKIEFTWWTLSMSLYSLPLPLDVMFKQITKQPISLLAALEIVTLFVKNRTFKQMQVIPLSKNSAKKNLFTIPVNSEWTAFNGPAEFKWKCTWTAPEPDLAMVFPIFQLFAKERRRWHCFQAPRWYLRMFYFHKERQPISEMCCWNCKNTLLVKSNPTHVSCQQLVLLTANRKTCHLEAFEKTLWILSIG